MGLLEKADFYLVDNEGATTEVYFFKIKKTNNKLKGLQIVGAFAWIDESAFSVDLEETLNDRKKWCDSHKDYKMLFCREKIGKYKFNHYSHELFMPGTYKGTNYLWHGNKRSDVRYTYENNMYDNKKTIKTQACAIALELMTRTGEINEYDYPNALKQLV